MGEINERILSTDRAEAFRAKVWAFYAVYGRQLPWRTEVSPYGVFVSEVMLQQTQVGRVVTRWSEFCQRFDGFRALAAASYADVLGEWQGMGYNRRALWLKRAAEEVIARYDGLLPRDVADLASLPGIGRNTAGSIAAFAYDAPTVFIETNIRRVFIHEFMGDAVAVHDVELMPMIAQTLDSERPREWYWALMDYGSSLARSVINPNRRSQQYRRQSTFDGSVRQMRGEILRRLLAEGPSDLNDLVADTRFRLAIEALLAEGAVARDGGRWQIAK